MKINNFDKKKMIDNDTKNDNKIKNLFKLKNFKILAKSKKPNFTT